MPPPVDLHVQEKARIVNNQPRSSSSIKQHHLQRPSLPWYWRGIGASACQRCSHADTWMNFSCIYRGRLRGKNTYTCTWYIPMESACERDRSRSLPTTWTSTCSPHLLWAQRDVLVQPDIMCHVSRHMSCNGAYDEVDAYMYVYMYVDVEKTTHVG